MTTTTPTGHTYTSRPPTPHHPPHPPTRRIHRITWTDLTTPETTEQLRRDLTLAA